MIGYTKTYCTQVVRTEHEVVFKEGMKAQGIKVYLSKVPDDAAFLELREGNDDEIVLAFRGEEQLSEKEK